MLREAYRVATRLQLIDLLDSVLRSNSCTTLLLNEMELIAKGQRLFLSNDASRWTAPPAYLFSAVQDFLELPDLFKMERVCKRWTEGKWPRVHLAATPTMTMNRVVALCNRLLRRVGPFARCHAFALDFRRAPDRSETTDEEAKHVLRRLLKQLPQLRSFSLLDGPWPIGCDTSSSSLSELAQRYPHLTFLSLSGCNISHFEWQKDALEPLAQLTQLTHLDLSQHSRRTIGGSRPTAAAGPAAAPPAATTLHSVSVQRTRRAGDSWLTEEGVYYCPLNFAPLGALTNLGYLALQNIFSFGNEDLRALAPHWPMLTCLKVNGTRCMEEMDVSGLTAVRALSISVLPDLSRSGVSELRVQGSWRARVNMGQLSGACNRFPLDTLRKLNVREFVSDEVIAVLAHAPLLESLELCLDHTTQWIKDETDFPSLRELKLWIAVTEGKSDDLSSIITSVGVLRRCEVLNLTILSGEMQVGWFLPWLRDWKCLRSLHLCVKTPITEAQRADLRAMLPTSKAKLTCETI